MFLTLNQINRKEVLQYLGWQGSEIPSDVDGLIDSSIAETIRESAPRYIWKKFRIHRDEENILPVDAQPFLTGEKSLPAGAQPFPDETKSLPAERLSLPEAGLDLPGDSLREMLADCRECILLAVTLGSAMDRTIARAKGRDLSRYVVLDACGSAAIEAACDQAEEEIRAQLGGGIFFTDRFSPGYSDFPLEKQGKLLAALDAERKIGLTMTESCIMLPRKSVTAVIGLADKPQKKRFRGCAYCSMFGRCTYRKAKKYCGRI